MKKLLAGGALIAALTFGLVEAQTVTAPTNVVAMVCANNTSVPAPASGQFFYVQCDNTGKLITSGSGSAGTVQSVTCNGGLSGGTFTVTGTCALALNNQVLTGAPTATNITTATQMFGMGGTCTLTPNHSTRIRVTFDGNIQNTASATTTSNVQTRFGTGTAPAGGTAQAGTAVGSAPAYSLFAIGSFVPFSQSRIVTGLTPGTAYWFDMDPTTISAGTVALTSITCTLEEID